MGHQSRNLMLDKERALVIGATRRLPGLSSNNSGISYKRRGRASRVINKPVNVLPLHALIRNMYLQIPSGPGCPPRPLVTTRTYSGSMYEHTKSQMAAGSIPYVSPHDLHDPSPMRTNSQHGLQTDHHPTVKPT